MLTDYLSDPDRIPQREVIQRLGDIINEAFEDVRMPSLPQWLIDEAADYDRLVAHQRRVAKKAGKLDEWDAKLRRLVETYRCWGKGVSSELKKEHLSAATAQELWLNLLWLMAANELSETRGSESECVSKE